MSQLLIRNLNPHVVTHLKNMAKLHHRSLQGEIKNILELVVSIPEEELVLLAEGSSKKKWPKGFFETVIGGWQGEALTRSDQGDYEDREDLK